MDVWGDLPKSQVDNSTVDDEINTLIDAHLADPDAHLEVGQSLQSHKASEIIDHLAHSIVRDKLTFDRLQIDEHFATIDAWGKYGLVTLTGICEVEIRTSNSSNNYSYMYTMPYDSMQDAGNPANFPNWVLRAKVSSDEEQEIFFGSCQLGVSSGYGFRIIDSSLYVFYYNNSLELVQTEIFGFTLPNTWHNYEFRSNIDGSCDFIIDGNVVYSCNLDDILNGAVFLYVYIKTTENYNKYIYLQSWHYDENYSA